MSPTTAAARNLPVPQSHRTGLPAAFVAIVLASVAYRAVVLHQLGLDPYADEAYYWGWAQTPDWGYYSKPPVIAALLAVSLRLFGDNLLALKAPALLLYPLAALLVHRLADRLLDSRRALLAGLAFLSLPLVSALGLFTSSDAPLLVCWAAGMLLLRRATHADRLRDWALLGLVGGLGMLSKYTMLAFGGCALLVLLADARGRAQLRRPGPWLALALAAAVFAPNLLWNWQHGFPTLQHTAEITRLGERGWQPDELAEFIGAQWLAAGPLLGLCLLWWARRLTALWQDDALRFLLLFTLPLLVLVALQAASGRANGNWAAPAYVGACVLAAALAADRARRRLLVAAIALNVGLGVAAYHWPAALQAAGIEARAGNDPYKRARGWQALAAALAPYAEAHPDAVLVADDRELLAQLVYHLRPATHARWQPPGARIADHYGLVAPYTAATRGAVLFVSPRPLAPAIRSRFAHVRHLAEVEVAVHRDHHRRATVWLLTDFQGY